jgi:PAS domain S-box-containing protein
MKPKLLLTLYLTIFIISFILLLRLHTSTVNEVIERFKIGQQITANQLSKELESCLNNETREIELLSSSTSVKNKNLSQMTTVIEKTFMYLKKDHIKSISVYNEKGMIIYSTLKEAGLVKSDDTQFFKWGTKKENEGKQFITTEVPQIFSPKDKKSTFLILIASPIYRVGSKEKYSDKFAGLVFAVVDIGEYLNSFFRNNNLHNAKENAWLLDKNGTVLFQPEHPEMLMFNMHNQDESCLECHGSFKYVENILARTSGTIEYQLKDNPKKLSSFATFNYKNISWKIVVNIPLDEVSNIINENLYQTLLLFAVIVSLLIGTGFFIFRSQRLKLKAEAATEKFLGQKAFNLILESAGEGIFGLDINGNHTFVNPMAAKLLGYKIEELIGKHSHSLWHHSHPNGEPYSGKDCYIYATLTEGTTHSGEEYFWRKDGIGFPVDFSTTPILEDDLITGAVVTFHDITERKLAEEALRASEEKFQLITKNFTDVIFITSVDGIITYISPSSINVFGYLSEEMENHFFGEFLIEDEIQRVFFSFGETIRTGISQKNLEMVAKRKNNETFYAELNASTITKNGQIVGTLGLIRDITERKQLEEERAKQREILGKLNSISNLLAEDMTLEQSLVKGLQIILSTSFLRFEQIGGVFLVENNKNELVLKCSLNLPKTIEDMCAHVPIGHCLCGRAFSTGEIQYSDCVDERHENIYPGIQPHGHYNVPIISNDEILGVIVVYLPEGHPYNTLEVGFLRSAADVFSAIINRKRAEELLTESERFIRETQIIANLGSYTMDIASGKWKSSEILDSLLGIDSDYDKSVEGWESLIHPEWKKIMGDYFIQEVIGENAKFDKEYKIIRQNDKGERWVHGIGELKFNDNNQPITMIGTIQDITERKKAEEDIQLKTEQLKKINSEKDKFFSIIAHDLKSPFNGLLGLTELMVSEDEDITKDELLDYSKSLNESASSIFKLLENLLEWAQMQKGSIPFSPKELTLSTITIQNIEILNQRALQKGVTLINEVDETQNVYADERMINTVLRNYLSNAVKFTKRDGKIIVRTKKLDNAMVEVSVQDTGVGMAEKDVNKLFKMEEKVGSKGTEGEPSTGLGLLLCKEFVEKNGGKVWADSEMGKGSIFYFTVPDSVVKNN